MSEQKVLRTHILDELLESSYRSEYVDRLRHNLRFSDAGAGVPEGEKCEREITYDLMDTHRVEVLQKPPLKKLLASGSLSFFSDGHLMESDIRRRLVHVLRSPEREVPDPATGARGKIDNTLYIASVKKLVQELHPDLDSTLLNEDPGLEIKTVNQFQFDEMARSGQVLQTYYDQVQKYLFASKLKWWIILVKNRNGFGEAHGQMPYLEFLVFPDKERFAAIQQGLTLTKAAAEESIKTGTNIVPRPFERESSKCRMCRFKLDCWGPDKPDLNAVSYPPDQALKAPDAELVESATRTYHQVGQDIDKLQEQRDEALTVLKLYFKATGEREFLAGEVRALAVRPTRTILLADVLRERMTKEQYAKYSAPLISTLEKAISARELDAQILEEATKVIFGELQVRVNPVKLPSERLAETTKGEAWRAGSRSTRTRLSTRNTSPSSPSKKGKGKLGKGQTRKPSRPGSSGSSSEAAATLSPTPSRPSKKPERSKRKSFKKR